MPFDPLSAVSAIDGRYRAAAEMLAPHFSEYALIQARVRMECEYLIALSGTPRLGLRRFSDKEKQFLRNLYSSFSIADAQEIKNIERTGSPDRPATNHDVKAVEYFLKDRLQDSSLSDVVEWIHFGLTSEDVNSVGHALCLSSALSETILPTLEEIRGELDRLSRKHEAVAMLARTHGQPASPTTFGKEMRVFESRIARQLSEIRDHAVLVKISGATGNYSAQSIGAPQVDWPAFAQRFVKHLNQDRIVKIGLNRATTQIEPHDTYAELFDAMRRVNTILIGLSQDIWRYISDGWIAQKQAAGEVGSSTMPHKVNPIDFENAEGNLGLANALFEFFSRKLPISRLQRDLSDSTVERAFGTAFAHSLIGFRSLLRGFSKIGVHRERMLEDLKRHPEVLAEAIQSRLRVLGVAVPYELLKSLTRGKEVTLADFAAFVDSLDIPASEKRALKQLRPETYIGRARDIAKGQQ